MKTKLYKLGFWFLLLVVFSLFNFYRIKIEDFEFTFNAEKAIYEKRINSLWNSNAILDREVAEVYDVNNQKLLLNKDSTYLVILLSDFDCAKCQERELIRVDSLRNQMKSKSINVIAITTEEKRNKSLIFKKQANLTIPIKVVNENIFKKELSFDTTKYPQLIFVKNGVKTFSFQPVTKDFEFSEVFYSKFLDKLNSEY